MSDPTFVTTTTLIVQTAERHMGFKTTGEERLLFWVQGSGFAFASGPTFSDFSWTLGALMLVLD